jgi:thiol-disulfide isomerase/thioredoxin
LNQKTKRVVNRSKRYSLYAGAGVLILCAFVILWWAGLPQSPDSVVTDGDLLEIAVVGGRVPAFEAETLNGEILTVTGDMRHPLIINFWATWCVPCIREMPMLENLFQEGVPVVGINTGLEVRQVIDEWLAEMNITFPLLDDDDETRSLEALYRIKSLPTTFFVDEQGIIRQIEIGALSEEALAMGLEAIQPRE